MSGFEAWWYCRKPQTREFRNITVSPDKWEVLYFQGFSICILHWFDVLIFSVDSEESDRDVRNSREEDAYRTAEKYQS